MIDSRHAGRMCWASWGCLPPCHFSRELVFFVVGMYLVQLAVEKQTRILSPQWVWIIHFLLKGCVWVTPCGYPPLVLRIAWCWFCFPCGPLTLTFLSVLSPQPFPMLDTPCLHISAWMVSSWGSHQTQKLRWSRRLWPHPQTCASEVAWC